VIGNAFGARASTAERRFVGSEAIGRAEQFAARYGDYGLVLCRPVPVLAEASVILAGVVGAPRRRFFVLTSWSNLGIAMVYAAVGAFAMEVESFLLAFAAALALPAVAMLIARPWKKGNAASRRT
jgi:membrane protein DedA with SNARE-associated domain